MRPILMVIAVLLAPVPASALCLQAFGKASSDKEHVAMPPALGAHPPPVGKPGIAIGKARHVWPAEPPNLWLETSRSAVWVRILDGEGRTAQSFKVEDPTRSCISYGRMYSSYRVISGRPDKAKGCHCW